MMNVRAIKNEDDYDWALTEIEQYFDQEPELGTPESDRFMVLSDLISAYEAKHWPVEAPDPIATVTAVMETIGYKQTDLAALLGSRSRASEILNRKRSLTTEMVWSLYKEWKIPAELLVRPYHLVK
ncbi:helix-turn-helix domain-containing protein [Niveispirillum cyanobacteriorum]|uniref:XRE family transcriptional regulator n=1 Tax=Niveispirillum cyanobacteriorum TaxID=1612173 RepID=A0A2K9NI97_9PROT|nr:XRE family transcriptional regulator [Niveispirillum cyanobacteriorum]AUN32814.1 XRE family transcriptional regulator [Niveispirillum cyanobacteriorum]GGE85535.1 transcriptional regulator [Niveispirillum cyanobacteriorum]